MTKLFEFDNYKNSSCPRTALILGYAGLIPFVVSILFIVLGIDFIVDPFKLLMYYGALILSFVGAVSWGFATLNVTKENNIQEYLLLWSVIPALLAFFALLINQTLGFFFLIFGFILAFVVDRKVGKILSVPSWYLFLRLRLTILVTSCLFVGLIKNLLLVAQN